MSSAALTVLVSIIVNIGEWYGEVVWSVGSNAEVDVVDGVVGDGEVMSSERRAVCLVLRGLEVGQLGGCERPPGFRLIV